MRPKRLPARRGPWIRVGRRGAEQCSVLALCEALEIWGSGLLESLYERRSVEISDLRAFYATLDGLWLADDLVDLRTAVVLAELGEPISERTLDNAESIGLSSLALFDVESLDVGDEALREIAGWRDFSPWPHALAGEILGRPLGAEEWPHAREVARSFIAALPLEDRPETWLHRHPTLLERPPTLRPSRQLLHVLAQRIRERASDAREAR